MEARGDLAGALNKLDEIEKLVLAAPNQWVREITLRNLRRWKAELNDGHDSTPAAAAVPATL